jgi:hypothetical protein
MARDATSLRQAVGEDPAFQRRIWLVQRCAWVVMAFVILLALLGGFGRGPFSAREAISPDGRLRVRYEAVLRQDSTTRWHIALPPGAAAFTIRSEALRDIEVVNSEPPLPRQARDASSARMELAPGPAGGLVSLTLHPARPGLLAFEVAIEGASVRFRSLVLP